MRKADLIIELEQKVLERRELERKSHISDEPNPVHITSNALTSSQYVTKLLSNFQQMGSSWRFVSVEKIDINIIEYKPIKGKSYIPLPKELETKKAIINMKNEDKECFKWCVARFFDIKDSHPERVDKDLKKQVEKLIWEKIEFPVSLQQITLFEKNNQDSNKIDLLLISNDETNHYCLITRIELPETNTMIEFENYKKTMRVPIVVYADFENSEDDDIAQIFVDNLKGDIKKIYNTYLKFPKKIVFTTENKENFNNAKVCLICEKDLKKEKIRDHCHIIGKYRGVAHNKCNLKHKLPKFIPVIFHNLTGYDSQLFIKKLSGELSSAGKINCIPNNEKKYISFSKEVKVNEYTNKKGKKVEVNQELRFIDSYRFMASSLDELVKNSINENYKELENKKLNLLFRKGVYPYEWVDSIIKLNET
ncbi:uncharacterized protein LOC136073078 [Hydra vulgaris]|uniref:uncharacterized protein LOC136073078 n=1 Tax=Hydra vulgaris TaxID=6087 RepID=UPI0032EA3A9E